MLSKDEARKGVVTHSSGNHGAALALAAATRGIKAYVIVPKGTPQVHDLHGWHHSDVSVQVAEVCCTVSGHMCWIQHH